MKKLTSIVGLALLVLIVIPGGAFAEDHISASSALDVHVGHGQGLLRARAHEEAADVHVSSSVSIHPPKRAIYGTVATISGTTLTVIGKNNTAYNVDASTAEITRRFGGHMTVGDIQSNDELNVSGIVNGTNVKAAVIRDMSLQTRNAEFNGSVKSVSTGLNGLLSFVLTTKHRGDVTIYTESTTAYKKDDRSGQATDVHVGSFVNVGGVWDRTNANVTATMVEVRRAPTSLHLIDIQGKVALNMSPTSSTLKVTVRNGITYIANVLHTLFVGKDLHTVAAADVKAGDTVKIGAIHADDSADLTAYLVRDLSL